MRTRFDISYSGGFSLIELLLALCVLGVCLAFGVAALSGSLRTVEGRGSAGSWQAAAAWAQVGALWHGGSTELAYESGSLSLSHEYGLCGGRVDGGSPHVPVATNVARWRHGSAAAVVFGGPLASPDGGGSLFFRAGAGTYRVVVRPESGLTSRALEITQ